MKSSPLGPNGARSSLRCAGAVVGILAVLLGPAGVASAQSSGAGYDDEGAERDGGAAGYDDADAGDDEPDLGEEEKIDRFGIILEAGGIAFFEIDGDIGVGDVGAGAMGDSFSFDQDSLDDDIVLAPFARAELDSRWVGLRASWFYLSWKGDTNVVSQQVDAGGEVFTAAGRAETEVDLHVGHLDLQLNLLNGEFLRLGVFGGGRALYTELDARSQAAADDGSPVFVSEDDDALFLAPIAGVDVAIWLLDVIEVFARAGYVDLDILGDDDIDGEILEVEAGVTLYPFGWMDDAPDFGFRVAYVHRELEVLHEDDDDRLNADLELRGVLASIVLRF